MSRIRSIHPGLWTDEAFVSLSPMSRLMLMGIWNECDDMGSFAWAPLTLKMRLLPADSVDASELLAEMCSAGIVLKYEVAGKPYGAVRNFCQYQRPKKPNSTYPQTDEVRDWVNTDARSTRDGSEPVGNQFGTGGEKCRQMEDGGGNRSIPLSNDNRPKAGGDQEFWATAKAYVQSESKNPGGVVGRWCRDYGKPETAQAITQAMVERPPTRIPYIEAILRKGGKSKPAIPI